MAGRSRSTPPLPSILSAPTPARWLDAARADPEAVLADHAHCERKAAGQAMALVAAHPEHAWLVGPMVRLAREELGHLARVLTLMGDCGRRWTADAGDPYARGLHRQARRHVLADRLLVAALIEARSCERLGLLGDAFAGSEVGRMWTSLARAEAGHHRLFLRLAARAEPAADALAARLAHLSQAEAALCEACAHLPRVH